MISDQGREGGAALPGAQRFVVPTLRSENLGVLAEDVFTSVHGKDGSSNNFTFLDEYGMFAICAAAYGQYGVLEGNKRRRWHGGVEPKD